MKKKYKINIVDDGKAVVVNGKKIVATDAFSIAKGFRPKVFLKDIIIKLDDTTEYSQSTTELKLWKRISKADRIFFGKIIAGQKQNKKKNRVGWVAQKRIKFKKGPIPNWAFEIVKSMLAKYGIGDVSAEANTNFRHNWAMNAETNLPIIFDFGVRSS